MLSRFQGNPEGTVSSKQHRRSRDIRQHKKEKEMNGIKRLALATALLMTPWVAAQNVVTDWNLTAITQARLSTAAGAATPGGAGLYVAYMQLAVYNAVNAIDGRFEPYKYSLTAPADAS